MTSALGWQPGDRLTVTARPAAHHAGHVAARWLPLQGWDTSPSFSLRLQAVDERGAYML
jgi:hypothetical protein